jgi:hypothetical protein
MVETTDLDTIEDRLFTFVAFPLGDVSIGKQHIEGVQTRLNARRAASDGGDGRGRLYLFGLGPP